MPALSIYDTAGNRIGEDAEGESERIQQFSSNGGRLTIDSSGDTTRVVVLFSASESPPADPERFYAVYQGDPQALHAGLQTQLEAHGLAPVPDDGTLYGLFVPGETTGELDETDPLDRAASVLGDGDSSQVKLGVDSYDRAERVVQYVLDEGYATRVAVADSVDSPALRGLDVVVEQGGYDGIELLPETERQLGEDDPAVRRPSADDRWSEPVTPPGRDPSGDNDGPRTAMILGVLGVTAVVLLLALGAALGGGIPFVGGGGETVTLELDSATIQGTDGVVTTGRLSGTRVDDTAFTVRLLEGKQGEGEALLRTQVAATPLGGGQFSLAVGPEQLDAATGEFDYLGGTEYEIVVDTDENVSGSVQVAPATLALALTDIRWSGESVDVTGTLRQGEAGVHGDRTVEISLGGDTLTRTVSPDEDGTFGLTITDDQTARNLSASGNLTVTATYEDVQDSTRTEKPAPPEPAFFGVAVQERTSPVTAGESVEVTAAVTNTGEREATRTVTLDAGPLGTDSATVTLGGDESATQTFTVETTAGDAGDYGLTLSSEDETTSTVVTVEQQPPEAEFTVEIAGTNTPVQAGENLTATVDIVNAGEAEATQTVQFEAAVFEGDSATVTLSPGAGTTETFAVETASSTTGEFVVGVASEDDEDTAFVAIEGDGDSLAGSLQVGIENTTSPVTVGDTASIEIGVTNTGSEARTELVEVDAGGLGSDSVEVSLPGGNATTRTVTFETNPGDAGQYPVTVSAADSTATGEVLVEGAGSASFQVLVKGTSDTIAGSSFQVTVVVTNAGDARGTDTVSLTTSPNLASGSFEATLDPGESTEETFSLSTDPGDAGQYDVTVTTSDDQATASLAVESAASGSFDVTITGTNAPVTAGDSLAVTAEITNTGGSEGTRTVTLTSDPALGSDSTELTLAAGGSTEETFSLATTTAGQYDLTVASTESQDSATVTVEEAAEATYAVAIAGTNEPVAAGETLEVTAEITNTAAGSGSQTVELTVGALGTATTQVELSGGESTTETLSFETAPGDAGEYTATLTSNTDEDTAPVTVGANTAQFELSGLDIAGQGDTAVVAEGESRQVAVDVTNVGGEPPDGPVEVTVEILGVNFSDTVQPGPGETETATVDDATGDLPAGNYDVTVSVDGNSLTGSLTVEIPVSLPGLDIGSPGSGSSATITEGDDEDIFVEVVNNGGSADSFSVNLDIVGPDGVVVDRTESTGEIQPDNGFVATFESATGDLSPGEYSIEASTVEYGSDETTGGSLTVQEPTAGSETGLPALAIG